MSKEGPDSERPRFSHLGAGNLPCMGRVFSRKVTSCWERICSGRGTAVERGQADSIGNYSARILDAGDTAVHRTDKNPVLFGVHRYCN